MSTSFTENTYPFKVSLDRLQGNQYLQYCATHTSKGTDKMSYSSGMMSLLAESIEICGSNEQLDRLRPSLGAKEASIATCLIEALGLSKNSVPAHLLLNWKTSSDESAGNFSDLAASVLKDRHTGEGGILTVDDVNVLLDDFSKSTKRLIGL